MEWREFIASLVDSLAWPGAIVVIVALVRSHLTDLLSGQLRRLRLGPGGAELEWQAVAHDVRADVVATARRMPTPQQDLAGAGVDLDNLDGLAARDPAEAIRATAAILLGELRRIVESGKPELLESTSNDYALTSAAARERLISQADAEALRGMLTLRDLSAHRPETATTERAVDFIVMSRAVLYALSRARPSMS
jgi:hypothetical protein